MTRSSIARASREVLLSVGALLGVVCLLATIAGAAFDIKPLIFRSGSMSPAIETGALGISRTVDATSLERGDVVSVTNASGIRVTHRVVDLAEQGSARQLTLKGDDNDLADAETYTVTRAEQVLFDIPLAGYIVDAAMKPVGIFVLGVYVAWMIALVLRRPGGGPRDGSADSEGRRRGGARRLKQSRGRRTAARSSAAVVSVAALAVAAPATAAWTDPVAATGTTLTAYTVPKPIITSCTVSGGLGQKTATIRFSEVTSPHAMDYTSTLAETGQSITVVDEGATRRVVFSAALLSTVLNQTYNVRIQARLPAPNGTWVSVNANQPVTIGLLGLSMSCGTAS